ncbi:hypothetical protein T8K17_21605 [Thalassobaculum sp. OXR-137]|uniref:hypothetical protein n=1 Tax=Thalassobaculum sp. OXR-137 TaxID=3100173 RepID=UPI002AC98151|nr:hypothetical protein [Thalassobaculum sp. OXR-137]WPZ33822.1 hypothetical protein T8K17_21605 [Thalassobaculum sp. OXR-137]
MPLHDSDERLLTMPGLHVPLALEAVEGYPILAQCLSVWRRDAVDRLPVTVDPVEMPVEAIKGISLIEWDPQIGDWVVRLSATLMDQGHGRSMTGVRMLETYRDEEYAGVSERLQTIMDSGEPDLARREFVGSRNRRWAYVRLILPLSSDGVKRDRYCLIYDPATFGHRIGV